MGFVKYYDIGLNLFCKQFPEPEKVIKEAEDNEVCCILTGTDIKEDKKINDFVKTHDVFGTAGIHPHNADRAKQEDFRLIEQILSENDKIVAVGECGLDYDRMFSTKENQIRCLEPNIKEYSGTSSEIKGNANICLITFDYLFDYFLITQK